MSLLRIVSLILCVISNTLAFNVSPLAVSVCGLESQSVDTQNVSFQYIVTTTSEPPKDLANPKGPYVVETLDATSEDGRLMRRRF